MIVHRLIALCGVCWLAVWCGMVACGPPADCKFAADCPRDTPVCEDGKCVPRQTDPKDGGDTIDSIEPGKECQDGYERDCYEGKEGTKDVGPCKAGKQICVDGKWGKCNEQVLPETETCNQKDDDCNGTIDDGCSCQPGDTEACYTGPDGTAGKGICKKGIRACDKDGKWGNCQNETLPGTESCNGTDDDCNGTIDDGCQCNPGETGSCYSGPTGTDGKGICRRGTRTCAPDGKWGTCTGEIKPGTETCNGKDDDCNGTTDDGCQCNPGDTQPCYSGPSGTDGKGPCKAGSQSCSASGKWGACQGAIEPKQETCNGLDDDCDGAIDNNLTPPNCSKTAGVCAGAKRTCQGTKGWQPCTDATYLAHNTAYEVTETKCDGKDNDCDGNVDESLQQACFTGSKGCTNNGTGYQCTGPCKAGVSVCASGSWGACTGEIKPATETCNNKDDDCDGSVDNGNPGGGQACTLSSLKGECAKGNMTCSGGTLSCQQVNQPKTEDCSNGKDDDCNGQIDDCGVCNNGETRPCYTAKGGCTQSGGKWTCNGRCRTGTQTCVNRQWAKTCTGQTLPATETCNWIDDNCDGIVDSGNACLYSSWKTLSSTSGIAHVSFFSPLIGVAVGAQGKVWRTTNGGSSWSTVSSGVSVALRFVVTSPKGLALVVGDGGTILRSINQGKTFAKVSSGTTQVLYSVSISANHLYAVAVGAGGTIVTSSDGGGAWTARTSSTSNTLYGVAFRQSSSSAYVVAVGASGTILRSTNNGATWSSVTSPSTQTLYGVAYQNTTAIVVGGAGTVLRSTNNGASWSAVSGFGSATLRTAVTPGRAMFVVAASGSSTYYVSSDDGASFTSHSPLVSGSFTGLALRSPTALVTVSSSRLAVGEGPVQFQGKEEAHTFRAVAYPNGYGSSKAYAVSTSGWLFYSSGTGDSWEPIYLPTTSSLYGVSFDGSDVVVVGSSGTIFHSDDGGKTWTKRTSPANNTLYGVAIYGSNAVIVGAAGVILHSGDTGLTWTKRTAPRTSSLYYGVTLKSSTALVVGSSGVIGRSTDGGKTWTRVGTGLFSGSLYGVYLYDTSDGIAVGSSGTVLTTGNGGSTWTKRTSGVSSTLYSVGMDFSRASAVGTNGTIIHSTNIGTTWSSSASNSANETLYGVFRRYTSGDYLAAGYNSRILKSTDYGKTYSFAIVPYSSLRGLVVTSSNSLVVGGSAGLLGRSTNAGSSWTHPSGGSRSSIYDMARSSSGTYVAIAASSTVFRSTNGTTWTSQVLSPSRTLGGVASPSSSTFVAVGSSGSIFRSTNGGSSFSSVSSPVTSQLRGISCTTTVCIAVGSSSAIVRSTNGGSSWSKINSPVSTTLYGVAMGSATNGVIVGSSGNALYTTNGGTSWTAVKIPQANTLYAVTALSSTRFLAGDSMGRVFLSANGGKTWATYAPNSNASIYRIKLSGNDGFAVGNASLRLRLTLP